MRIRSTLIALLVAGSLLGGCHKRAGAAGREPGRPRIRRPSRRARSADGGSRAGSDAEAQADARRPRPLPKPTADEQMLDDADATGMTSHATRDTDDASGSGNTQN